MSEGASGRRPPIEVWLGRIEFAGVALLLSALAHSEALKSAGLILALLALAVRLALGSRPAWLRKPTVWAAAGVVLTAVVAVVAAEPGWRHPMKLSALGGMIAVYILVLDVVTSRRRLEVLVGALLLGTAAGVAVSSWTPSLRNGRFALPSLPNPVVAGEYLAGVLPLAFWTVMLRRARPLTRTLSLAVALAGTAALWLTVSRGPLLACALGLALLVSIQARRAWVAALVLVPVAALAIGLSVTEPTSRLVGDRLEDAVRIRTDIWSQTLELVAERPVTGHGPGTFGRLDVRVTDGSGPHRTMHAHNVMLHLLVERGILGFAAFALFVGLAVRDMVRGLRTAPRGRPSPVPAVAASVAALLVAGLSSLTLRAEPGMLFYAMLGLGSFRSMRGADDEAGE